MELRRILDARRALRGLELMGEVGATAVVLPELEALRGVQQSRYHHRDVYDHTLEVLERTIALQEDPLALLGGGRRESHGESGRLAGGGAPRWRGARPRRAPSRRSARCWPSRSPTG